MSTKPTNLLKTKENQAITLKQKAEIKNVFFSPLIVELDDTLEAKLWKKEARGHIRLNIQAEKEIKGRNLTLKERAKIVSDIEQEYCAEVEKEANKYSGFSGKLLLVFLVIITVVLGFSRLRRRR